MVAAFRLNAARVPVAGGQRAELFCQFADARIRLVSDELDPLVRARTRARLRLRGMGRGRGRGRVWASPHPNPSQAALTSAYPQP